MGSAPFPTAVLGYPGCARQTACFYPGCAEPLKGKPGRKFVESSGATFWEEEIPKPPNRVHNCENAGVNHMFFWASILPDAPKQSRLLREIDDRTKAEHWCWSFWSPLCQTLGLFLSHFSLCLTLVTFTENPASGKIYKVLDPFGLSAQEEGFPMPPPSVLNCLVANLNYDIYFSVG